MGYGSFTVLYFMLLVAYLLMMRVHYVMKISSILIVSLECPIAQFTDTHEIHYSTLALFGSLFCYTLVVQVSDVCLMVYIYIMPIILIMLYIILVKCFLSVCTCISYTASEYMGPLSNCFPCLHPSQLAAGVHSVSACV